MNTPTLIKHESPSGPYWYHPDHPLCQDGKVLWEEHVECKDCGGAGTRVEGEQGAQYQAACEHCEGTGFVAVEPPSGTESETHNSMICGKD